MALLVTDKKSEIEALAKTIETRMGRHAADARDTCLAGTPDQIREQLHQLKANGASVLFIPSLFRPLPELRRDLDRFIAEIAPAFRWPGGPQCCRRPGLAGGWRRPTQYFLDRQPESQQPLFPAARAVQRDSDGHLRHRSESGGDREAGDPRVAAGIRVAD